jgi:hypothetical protein
MKYIAFPIDEIDTVMQICLGEVMRYEDMQKKETDTNQKIVDEIYKSKWKGKVEALGEMLKFGIECNEIN